MAHPISCVDMLYSNSKNTMKVASTQMLIIDLKHREQMFPYGGMYSTYMECIYLYIFHVQN